MKRFLIVCALLLAVPGWAGDFINFPNFPARGQGPFDKGGVWWNNSSLTFYAPFDSPSDPLRLIKGTGTLSFTRATTATYVHPTTGLVTTAASGQLRIESNGALGEGQQTNVILWSRVFDNEAWVATNVSVAANQTGEDGVATSAYSLWATADNGTLCQPVTIASAAYSGAWSIKRITGTGAVQLSLDNGATWGSDVAGSLSSSAWYRASKANQVLANPELCIRLATSGDNVAIDYAQIEERAFISSRIRTTTAAVTRNSDSLTYPTVGLFSDSAGTISVTFDRAAVIEVLGGNYVVRGGSSSSRFIYGAGGENYGSYDGTSVSSYITPTVVNTTYNVATTWDASTRSASYNGRAIISAAYDGAWTVGANMNIGSDGTANTTIHHVKNLKIWNRTFTGAELQAITK